MILNQPYVDALTLFVPTLRKYMYIIIIKLTAEVITVISKVTFENYLLLLTQNEHQLKIYSKGREVIVYSDGLLVLFAIILP